MPKHGPSIQPDDPSQLLNAFSRYLQYDEVPANVDKDTLWRRAYGMLLRMAGNRRQYGNFMARLQGEVTPEDIVQDVLEHAVKYMRDKAHKPPAGFNYKKNIKWKWSEYEERYAGKDPYDNEAHTDESAILAICLLHAENANELGYRVFKMQYQEHLDNDEITRKLERSPLEIASAYFEFLCELKICLEDDEASARCWLRLRDSHPRLFVTEAVYAMNYQPKPRIYQILGVAQQTVSKRRKEAEQRIEQCRKEATV